MMEAGNVHTNVAYRYCDLFIQPKYKNIKEEVMNVSNSCSISPIQHQNTLKKSELKYSALSQYVNGANHIFKIVYGISAGSKIKLHHILAVLLYCNHTILSAAFSKSFRKLKVSETDESLKNRHSLYANWAKKLKEAVSMDNKCIWGGVTYI